MNLKALMQKLEIIDKKQNLMEAEKKETTWTDKSGKKHPATQVKGDKYTGKEAEKDAKKKADEGITFNGSIANALLREFGLEEAPVTNPWANDPAKSAAWSALSPQDQAWLGGADPTDPYILARAPNKGKPATPAPAATATPGNTDPTKGSVDYSLGGGKKRTALPQVPPTDGQAAQPAEPAKPAEVPHGINPETGEKYTSIADAPLQEPPGAEKTPDPKKKQMAPVDPGTQELQKWIASKGYNIGAAGADGRLGPNTNKALDAFMADWKAGKISEPDKQQYQKLLGGAKDTEWTKQWFAKANAASGGQAAQPAAGGKGPTVAAAQGQQPGNPLNQKPGGQAAQPAAAPAPAAPTRGGATPIAKQQPKAAPTATPTRGYQSGGAAAQPSAQPAAAPAGKVDLSVNNPAMNPANNAPLPTPGTAPSGQAAQPKAAPSAADDAVYQMAKAAGATGSTSTQQFTGANAKDQAFSKVQSPQQMLAQQQVDRAKAKAAAVAPGGNGSGTLQGGQVARESVQSLDDAILQRIRNALFR